MNIAHIAAYTNNNAGDSALQYGLRRVLGEDWPEDLKFTDVHFGQPEIEHNTDLIVFGGGGMISGKKTTPFDFLVKKGMRAPVIVYGVGHSLFKDQTCYTKSAQVVKSQALAFSVRNDGSKERLGWDVDVVPDPGLWIEAEDTDERYDVIFQVAGDYQLARYGIVMEYVKDARKIAAKLKGAGLSVIFVAHTPKDNRLVKTCGKPHRLAGDNSDLSHVREFFGVYKNARCVVATRGHSQICAYGLGVPFVTIATQSKQEGFARECGLGEYVHIPREDKFIDNVVWSTLELIEHPPIIDTSEWREEARTYHKQLWSKLNV